MPASGHERSRVMRFEVVIDASAGKPCFRQFYAWALIADAVPSPARPPYNRPHSEKAKWRNPQYLVALPRGVPTRGARRNFDAGFGDTRRRFFPAENEANTEV